MSLPTMDPAVVMGGSECVKIDALPTEIMEYILQLLRPYEDLKSAMCVCKLWHELGHGIISRMQTNFQNLLNNGNFLVSHLDSQRTMNQESSVRMAERYSHASVYYKGSIYVFGGSTKTGMSNTTFNDTWSFDLNQRIWQRPQVSGKFPSPKAAASMVLYNDEFILFGGYCEPTPSPFFQSEQLFSELHVLAPSSGVWRQLQLSCHPPATAGHSATVCGDAMIMFGGSRGIMDCTNDVYCLNLITWTWSKPYIKEPMPWPRFGQQQVTVDDCHVAIIGGRTGPAMAMVHSDVWLLNVRTWSWTEIVVNNPQNIPPHLWSRGSCSTNQKLVVVSKYQKRPEEGPQYDIRPANQLSDYKRPRSSTSNQSLRSKSSTNQRTDLSHAQNSVVRREDNSTLTSRPAIRPNSMFNRQKQLDMLKKYEQIIQFKKTKIDARTGRVEYPNPFHIHTMDFSKIVTEKEVTWSRVMQCACATACRRKEIFFYSLVSARAEIILIGGLRSPFLQVGGITKTTPAETSRDVFVFTLPDDEIL